MKKTVSVITLLCLVIALAFPVASGAVQYDDIAGHWAQQAVDSWSEKNIINGYDGKFRPDDSITRGEMAVILHRVMKFEGEAVNTFIDLDQNFYTSAMLKANHAGVILGDGERIRPDDAITLQETVVMMCRAFGIAKSDARATEFIDDDHITDWARSYVCAMVEAGYLRGSEGYLNPNTDVTRAQVITILDNIYKSGQKTLRAKIDGEAPEPSNSPEPKPSPEISATPSPTPSSTPENTDGDEDGDLFSGGGVSTPDTNGIKIETTLSDGMTQKGSKRTFDVWALDKNGGKIPVSATLNGDPVTVNWDDNTKTSFTLNFSTEGENIVVVTAKDFENYSKSVTYRIIYERGEDGRVIGTSVWSIEVFALGTGYLIPPQMVDIIEGENAAMTLDRLIKQAGFEYEHTGTLASDFYLSFIKDGQNQLNLNPQIPQILADRLQHDMDYYDLTAFERGKLGEFDFSNGSGWMYSVNNIFPNVGFADTYLSSGDVVRVQYTLSYGMDNGGYGSLGEGDVNSMYFESPDRDDVTVRIAAKGIENCDPKALEIVTKIDASSAEIRAALKLLN